jgi:formate dehydrogenase maturation protein FdhE
MSGSHAIDRALELEKRYPAAAEMLRYYREHAAAQEAAKPGDRHQRPRGAESAPWDACVSPPDCAHTPLVAVLRPEGEGARRMLLCESCGTEYEFRRLVCPFCGEEDHTKLPVYTAEEFPHIRIEACDTCHRYIKAIDLTRDGRAVPEVDDIASVALDLWAAEKGYGDI